MHYEFISLRNFTLDISFGEGTKIICGYATFVERNDYSSKVWKRLKLSVKTLFSSILWCDKFDV